MRRIEEFTVRFEPETPELTSLVFEVFDSLKSAVIFVFVIFSFFLRPVSVEGYSMYPTLTDKDWVAVSSTYRDFKYGDIVVINQPWEKNVPIIKRVIAVGGDTVNIDFLSREVYVNGKLLDEPYIAEKTYLFYDIAFPITVEEGKVFVMGDNRNDSLDSRSSKIGTIDERYIIGKAKFRFWPMFRYDIYNGVE